MEEKLKKIISSVPAFDAAAAGIAYAREASLAKPPRSLGVLEDLAVKLAGMTGRALPEIKSGRVLVFAADNGVVSKGVSSAPQSVTAAQTVNLTRGLTGASAIARARGYALTVCDVGVCADLSRFPEIINKKTAFGARDITEGAAMTREECIKTIISGFELAASQTEDVLGIGEMGIGNTTTSAAVLSALCGVSPESVTGRGGGLTDEGLSRKISAIKAALEVNSPDGRDPVDVLSKVGGFDIAAMCGAYLGTASIRRPAVIDGFISAVAALCAARLCPGVSDYLICSHRSVEPGYDLCVRELGARPLFDLEMRLGEGSGCPIAFDILKAACAAHNGMATFTDAKIDDSYLAPIRAESARVILVSGENGSGKSRFAEGLFEKIPGKKYYLATMRSVTPENEKRIKKHIAARAHIGFETVEAPLSVSDAGIQPGAAVLLEDASNLLANCVFEKGLSDSEVFEDIKRLSDKCRLLVIVTISGLEPQGKDAATDGYIRALSGLNARISYLADACVNMQNGAPCVTKGEI
ncbi:MAG: nicotinate-nucleotide--dimethylbenzimidazole phosphoribosyltransferase [Clostridia bacterium]|nr:nicotinate-nucleotide--dimethylbenzimidazole phosphoribosyltransferase [Clostridia bacterium]